MLNQSDKKWWQPNERVLNFLQNRHAKKKAKILDVGPGHAPLPWATDAVDFVEVPNAPVPVVKADLSNEKLPYKDKAFDFVYCRHVLEDMFNPFLLCAEMSRVGKSGYIEMPSPIAELARGVDGGSPPFRGYHHHRFIGWVFGNELRFISKYPFIEYIRINEDQLDDLLRKGPEYWNTYYIWEDRINFSHRQSPLHYDIPTQYVVLLADAVERSREATNLFFDKISQKT